MIILRRGFFGVMGLFATCLLALLFTYSLALAAAASGASGLKYSGETSQKRPISFRVSGGFVRHLDFHIEDRCPHKRRLFVRDYGFPAMRIKHSKFGGTFVARDGAIAKVRGKKSGRTVSGTLTDRSKNPKTHKSCSGTATFSLAHK